MIRIRSKKNLEPAADMANRRRSFTLYLLFCCSRRRHDQQFLGSTGSETFMKYPVTLVLAAALLASCRTYDYRDRTSKDAGLMPAEQYARYGREQAELVAAGRELAHASADSVQQAAAYA